MGWVIGIAAFSPFALCLEFLSPENTLSDITGRVTYSGRPLNDMTICLDSPGGVHAAYCALRSDGSFRLLRWTEGRAGVYRGRYNAHLYTHRRHGPSLPAKYANPGSSGVEIEIDSDWSDLNIDLN